MRFVFVGASRLSRMATELLVGRGHEVVIIEMSKERIDSLADELDCGFLHGDGSKPALLREAGPEQTDALFSLTDDDRVNILACLIGRSLGFKRVVPRVVDIELMSICTELGLDDAIIPDQTTSRHVADMAEGFGAIELSTMIRGEARFFSFVVTEAEAGQTIADLDLPAQCRVVCLYREGELIFADPDTKLHEHDEVVLLTHSKHLGQLRQRWQPRQAK